MGKMILTSGTTLLSACALAASVVTDLFARPAADRPTSCFCNSAGRADLIALENMARIDVVVRRRERGDGVGMKLDLSCLVKIMLRERSAKSG